MADGAEGVYVVAVVMMIPVRFVVLHAEAILPVAAAIFKGVEKTVFFKERECAKDAATIHIGQRILYIGQREGIVDAQYLPPDKLAHGCRADVMGKKYFGFGHGNWFRSYWSFGVQKFRSSDNGTACTMA